MKRRRLQDSANAGVNDGITHIIGNYLNFVMRGEPGLKYWKERGFEQFVSYYKFFVLTMIILAFVDANRTKISLFASY
jgi:hypothetical protein